MQIFPLFTSMMLLMFHVCFSLERVCSGSTSPPCCADYRWSSKMEMCIECLPGFYGINCSETCRYPNYGDGCQHKCYCTEHRCHAVIGCHEFETDRGKMVSSTSTSNILLGCLVFLVAVLVLLKVVRYFSRCRALFQQQNNRPYSSRYASVRFSTRPRN